MSDNYVVLIMNNASRGGKTVSGTRAMTIDAFMNQPVKWDDGGNIVIPGHDRLYLVPLNGEGFAYKFNQIDPELAIELFGPYKGQTPVYDYLVSRRKSIYSSYSYSQPAPLKQVTVKALEKLDA